MVHKDEMCAFFKTLSSVDRIEIICGMLQLCVPQELRFVGAFLEDIIQKNYNYFTDVETVANDINHLKELSHSKSNADKEFYARLNMYLSLLHSDNNVCAEAIFSILEEIKENLELHFDQDLVSKNISDKENDFLNDVILVFTLASYHPAFTIKQRLYMYEVCKSMKESLKRTTSINKKTEETTFSSQGLSPLRILVEPLKSTDNDQSCLIEVYWANGHKTKCYRSKGSVQSFISQFSNAFPSVKLHSSADVFDTLKSLFDDLLPQSKSIVNSDFILNFLQDSAKLPIDDDEDDEDDEYDDANDEDEYDDDDYVSSDNRLDTNYTKIHHPTNHHFFNNELNQPGVSSNYASYMRDGVKSEELSGGDIYQSHMNFPKDQCHMHSSCFECIKKSKRIPQHYTYDKLTNGVLYDSSSSSSSSSGGADNCSTSSCNNNIDEEAEDKLRDVQKIISMGISPLSSSSVASSPPKKSLSQGKNVSNDFNENILKQNQNISSQLNKASLKNNLISPVIINNNVTSHTAQTPSPPLTLNQVSSKSSSNTASLSISLASISSSRTLPSQSLDSNVLASKNSAPERINKLTKKLKKTSHSKFSRYENTSSSTNNMTSTTTSQVTNMLDSMKGCEEVLSEPLMQCCMPDCHMLPGGGDHSIKHHNVLKSPQTYPVLAMFQSPSGTSEGSVQDKNLSTKPLRPILGASANQNMTCNEENPTDSSKPPISTSVAMHETPLIVSDSYPIHLFPPQAPPFHYFLGTVFNNANNPDFMHPPFSHFSPIDYHSARMHPPPNLHPPNQATSNSGAPISNSNNLPPYYNLWNHPRSPHILFRHMPPPYPHIIRDNQIIIPPPPLPSHLTFDHPCSIINTTHPPPVVVPSPINNKNHDVIYSNNNTNNNNNNLTVVDVATITNRKGKNSFNIGNISSSNNINNNNNALSIISSSVVHSKVTTAMPNNNVIRTDLNNNSNVNNNNLDMNNVNNDKNITNNIDCKVKYSNAVKSSISSIPNLNIFENNNSNNMQPNENKNTDKNHSVSNKTDVTTQNSIVSIKSEVADRREFCYNCGSQQHAASSCTETLMVALGQSAQFKLKTVPKAKTASS